ncbi:glycosyltransferase family 4 protein [Kitasatospora sp. NPDC127111]|uniref:glycosyltransferase family 4 protein n=1 Tax=Kitasatospora sp. NPDC127111 TaxID=3345363 RepID=UPI003639C924
MTPNPTAADRAASSHGVLLVLLSWAPDAPAGIERATAALAVGLTQAGHRPVIATAATQPAGPAPLPGVAIERLDLTGVTFPCNDAVLRHAVTWQDGSLARQIGELITRHCIDTVLFTDALWGLGRLRGHLPRHVRRVLAAHVRPATLDAGPAMARAHHVIVPSAVVRDELATWRSENVTVVPNALLAQPPIAPPGPDRRAELRCGGPIRVLARLGAEKGVAELLEAAAGWDRPFEVALAEAGFEDTTGSQAALLERCQALAARHAHVRLRGALPWKEVLPWLADAAAVIVPSHRETFGLVALEAMSVGTPVIAYRVGNLPALIDPTRYGEHLLVPRDAGPDALHETARTLLVDDILYAATTQAVYRRAMDFDPHRIANLLLEAIS